MDASKGRKRGAIFSLRLIFSDSYSGLQTFPFTSNYADMAELALGAVGVVPIIGIAIKSFKIICSELNTFQHCSSHVRRLYDQLKVQRQIFENECTLLLRDCLDDGPLVDRMIADPSHRFWEDDRSDEDLRVLLKSSYKVCSGLVQTILEAVQKLESGLACFHSLKSKQEKVKPLPLPRLCSLSSPFKLTVRGNKGERIRDTWKRVRDGMRLSYNKSNYKEDLNDIRVANIDLKALCEQVTRLQTPCKMISLKRPATSQGWSEIRRAAKALHEALIGAWSCEKASHLRHFVKLFLEAEKADENVHMDIAILCHGIGRDPAEASLIQLQVRSGYVAWMQTPRLFVPADPGSERPKKRLKSVRFTEECSAATCTITSTAPGPASCTAQLEVQDSADLRAARDFCAELTTRCGQTHPVGTRCLGHLDVNSSDPLRHYFYPSPTITRGPRPTGEPLPMDAFLRSAQHVSPADRLRMARSLVLAVLKFNATPWLSDEWTLGDFSLFRARDVPSALHTLHLGVEFDRGAMMEDVQLGRRLSEDELLLCGIENMTLHSLGVALLQIERQEGLAVDARDVVGVRRAAKVTADFGQRYQRIARMCLACNFGFGADLGKGKLQRAVYEELIGELETMISNFSIDD